MTLIEKHKLAYRATFILLIGLLIFMGIETFSYKPSTLNYDLTQTRLLVILIKSLPLILFIYPLLKKQAMAGVWLGLVLMFYFCLAVMESFNNNYLGTLAIFRSLLIATLFMSSMFYTRYQKQLDAEQTSNGIKRVDE